MPEIGQFLASKAISLGSYQETDQRQLFLPFNDNWNYRLR